MASILPPYLRQPGDARLDTRKVSTLQPYIAAGHVGFFHIKGRVLGVKGLEGFF